VFSDEEMRIVDEMLRQLHQEIEEMKMQGTQAFTWHFYDASVHLVGRANFPDFVSPISSSLRGALGIHTRTMVRFSLQYLSRPHRA
jgi:hypothetical protein